MYCLLLGHPASIFRSLIVIRRTAFKSRGFLSESELESKMTSVLNVGVMPNNPVGIQVRRLEAALEAERKDKQMLLLALEVKAPEVFAE